MTQIFLRDGKVVLCQEAPTSCPIPCGLSISWLTCNNETLASTLTGNADFTYAREVQFGTLCYYGPFGDPEQNTDLYWIVANATPDEIQEPGGGYANPIPEMADPATGVCRFVWRIFTGRGNFFITLLDLTTAPATSTPDSCAYAPGEYSRYAWLGYADVNKCTGEVLDTGLVLDEDYDFSAWPVDEPLGCACNYIDPACEATPPTFSVSSYFAPDCCV